MLLKDHPANQSQVFLADGAARLSEHVHLRSFQQIFECGYFQMEPQKKHQKKREKNADFWLLVIIKEPLTSLVVAELSSLFKEVENGQSCASR